MKQRSKKAKGAGLEKLICDELLAIGVDAKRQPGSGIYKEYPKDVIAKIPEIGEMLVECKAHKNGWATGDKYMGHADFLIMKPNYKEPRVYMRWSTFKKIVMALKKRG